MFVSQWIRKEIGETLNLSEPENKITKSNSPQSLVTQLAIYFNDYALMNTSFAIPRGKNRT